MMLLAVLNTFRGWSCLFERIINYVNKQKNQAYAGSGGLFYFNYVHELCQMYTIGHDAKKNRVHPQTMTTNEL